MKFLEKFSKFHQIFFYKLFSAEGQTETGSEIMHRNSQFHTPLQLRCKSTEILQYFWLSCRECSRYHITVYQEKLSFNFMKEHTYTEHHAAYLMLIQISSVSRTIRVRAVCLMSVPLHNII